VVTKVGNPTDAEAPRTSAGGHGSLPDAQNVHQMCTRTANRERIENTKPLQGSGLAR
jgi:hypothetical protein